jgi:hypothetical protein
MSDIDSLRQRIEHAELRLKTAHTARQRESVALTTMWDQIRDRFSAQSAEIVRLRDRVAELEDTRDELSAMVRALLGSVESSIERMADETVPQITGLAESLLESDPSAIVADIPAAAEPEPVDDHDPAPAAVESDSVASEDDTSFSTELARQFDEVPAVPPPPPSAPATDPAPAGEPVSPGIRSLITRIEGAFERKPIPAAPTAEAAEPPAPDDSELARDLDDIRRLREELQSLRSRIGAGR